MYEQSKKTFRECCEQDTVEWHDHCRHRKRQIQPVRTPSSESFCLIRKRKIFLQNPNCIVSSDNRSLYCAFRPFFVFLFCSIAQSDEDFDISRTQNHVKRLYYSIKAHTEVLIPSAGLQAPSQKYDPCIVHTSHERR